MTPRPPGAAGYLGPEREQERAREIVRSRLASPPAPKRPTLQDAAGPLFAPPDLFDRRGA